MVSPQGMPVVLPSLPSCPLVWGGATARISFVKKAPRPWRVNRPVGRGRPSVGMSDPGLPYLLRGGLVFWPLGGRSGSPGGSVDPSANGGKRGSSLDQRWATCLSFGGRSGLSGPSADREEGTPTPDSCSWRGAHSGRQGTAAGADWARGSPGRDGGAAVVPICGLCGAVERGFAGSSECVDPEDPLAPFVVDRYGNYDNSGN